MGPSSSPQGKITGSAQTAEGTANRRPIGTPRTTRKGTQRAAHRQLTDAVRSVDEHAIEAAWAPDGRPTNATCAPYGHPTGVCGLNVYRTWNTRGVPVGVRGISLDYA